MNVSVKQMKGFVRKMRVSSNMILLLQEGSPLAEMQNIKNLAQAVDVMGFKNVLVLVVKDFDKDIRALDKHAMAKHGWFFADDMNRLMRSQKDVPSKDNTPAVRDGHPVRAD